MIEFKNNGPFVKDNDESESPRVKIIGVGSAGVNALDQMVLDEYGQESLISVDTHRPTLDGSVVEKTILIGARLLKGLGMGGDADLVKDLTEEDWKLVRAELKGTNIGILVFGLGGGTGGSVTAQIADILREEGASVILLAVSPLSCEGARRSNQARQQASILRSKADAFFLFSNNRLAVLADADDDARDIFKAMNVSLGAACKTVASLLGRRGLVQLDISDLKSLAGQCAGLAGELENCWIGAAEAGGASRSHAVVEHVINSPLFRDGAAWSAGDKALAYVEGGEDLSVSEFQELVERLKGELPDIHLAAGAAISPTRTGLLSLTLFIARSGEDVVVTEELPAAPASVEKTDDQPAASPSENTPASLSVKTKMFAPLPVAETEKEDSSKIGKRQSRPQRYFAAEQDEFPFDSKILRGRFEKSDPTILNGQNLDQPTFLRLGLKIRL
ncbi:MAG: hypothetical protein V1746_07825 [bacterium]